MELSILIARIVSIVYLSAALGMIFSKKFYQKILEDFFKNAGVSYLAGFFTIVVSFLIVHYHNTWESNWTVLVTIIGWLGLIKGVVLIAFPSSIYKLSRRMYSGKSLKIFPFIHIALGLLFAYFGFIA